MRLLISFAARDRAFGKAMRRIRPAFDSLCSAFENQTLMNPVHEALLVGITDDLPDSEIREIKNSDGFFQVLCGFTSNGSYPLDNDMALKQMLFGKIRAAVEACPFSTPDRQSYRRLLDNWSSAELKG